MLITTGLATWVLSELSGSESTTLELEEVISKFKITMWSGEYVSKSSHDPLAHGLFCQHSAQCFGSPIQLIFLPAEFGQAYPNSAPIFFYFALLHCSKTLPIQPQFYAYFAPSCHIKFMNSISSIQFSAYYIVK